MVGACNGIFALAVPHLHNLRVWSAIACACTVVFVIIVIGISAYDGAPLALPVHALSDLCCFSAA